MTDLTLYHWPQSRASTTLWMLEEVGEPYAVELVDITQGAQKRPEFLEINPMGKVPTLRHGETIVTEAAAICAYLADAFPNAGLAPDRTDRRRGPYYRWLFHAAGCVEPAVSDRMFNRPPVERPGAIGYGTYEDTFAALESAVQPGPWILGETFSAADVYLGSTLSWVRMFGGLPDSPALNAYADRIEARPTYKRYMEKNMGLMPEAPQAA